MPLKITNTLVTYSKSRINHPVNTYIPSILPSYLPTHQCIRLHTCCCGRRWHQPGCSFFKYRWGSHSGSSGLLNLITRYKIAAVHSDFVVVAVLFLRSIVLTYQATGDITGDILVEDLVKWLRWIINQPALDVRGSMEADVRVSIRHGVDILCLIRKQNIDTVSLLIIIPAGPFALLDETSC